MIVDTSLTVSYKCPFCGVFEFSSISLFELVKNKEHHFLCRCRKSGIYVTKTSHSGYLVRVPCIACGNDHEQKIGANELVNGLNIYYCPNMRIQYCFVGNDMQVRRNIDMLEKELDELIDNLGFDSYFKNTQVMFDSMNKIHDIAEQGNLFCECGKNDIELTMLSDKILLRCKRCSGNTVVRAGSNEDLKFILKMQHIFLQGDISRKNYKSF